MVHRSCVGFACITGYVNCTYSGQIVNLLSAILSTILAFLGKYALRAKMATLKKSPSPPRYSRPLLHLRRRRWVDAAETAELGGLRRRGAHRPGELLMLSTVAQTSSPRHSPGRRDLKPSPHPTRVLSHPLLLGTQGVSGLVLHSCSSMLEMRGNPPPLGRQDLRTSSRLE